MPNCDHCPVSGACHGTGTRPHFCGWAATGEPAKLMMIRDLAAMPPVSFDPVPAPHVPGLLTRAANLAGAVAEVVAHAAAGNPTFASAETAAARLAICHACPHLVGGTTCGDYDGVKGCGCNIPYKTTLAALSCPVGKWGAEPAGPPP